MCKGRKKNKYEYLQLAPCFDANKRIKRVHKKANCVFLDYQNRFGFIGASKPPKRPRTIGHGNNWLRRVIDTSRATLSGTQHYHELID